MYDVHGSEEGFQSQFNPNNIDPNEIFKMFFQQSGGDPFANLFSGGSSFTMYSSNLGGGGATHFTTGGTRRRQQQDPFGGGAGINIFDLLNGAGQQRPRRRNQQQMDEREGEELHDPFNIFQQQKFARGRNNRQQREKPGPNVVSINLLNNCFP